MGEMLNTTTSLRNSTENSTLVEIPEDEERTSAALEWPQLLTVVLLSLVIAVTVVGNTLVIAAVLTTRRLRTVTNCFVTSLAVADWMVAVFVMPPAIAYQTMGSWELGWIMCDIWVSLDVLLCTASILSLGAISIDRYLAVTQPLIYSRRRRSKRLALAMILAVWLAAAAITCPPIFGWYEPGRHARKECRYNQNQGYVIFSAMGSFFLPLAVMLYVYGRISCVIARRLDPLAAASGEYRSRVEVERPPSSSDTDGPPRNMGMSTSTPPQMLRPQPCCTQLHVTTLDANGGGNDMCSGRVIKRASVYRHGGLQDGTRTSGRISSFRRESKTAQTLSLVVGGFVACWLPFFVLYIITPFLPKAPSPELANSLTWLGWINSAINPFIYAFYSPDFRVAFWRLTFKRCSRSPRHAPFAGNGAPFVADPLSRNSQGPSMRRKIPLA